MEPRRPATHRRRRPRDVAGRRDRDQSGGGRRGRGRTDTRTGSARRRDRPALDAAPGPAQTLVAHRTVAGHATGGPHDHDKVAYGGADRRPGPAGEPDPAADPHGAAVARAPGRTGPPRRDRTAPRTRAGVGTPRSRRRRPGTVDGLIRAGPVRKLRASPRNVAVLRLLGEPTGQL